MSPGAFWGRPGSASVNPYINPAVGAPVHTGYFPPVPPRQQAAEEGYFPPFAAASGASRPSGLANEILREHSGVRASPGASDGAATDVGTGTSTTAAGTDASSRGTSWHTDSDADAEKAEHAVSPEDDDEEQGPGEGQARVRANGVGAPGKPRAYSAESAVGGAGRGTLARADSDPIKQALKTAGVE